MDGAFDGRKAKEDIQRDADLLGEVPLWLELRILQGYGRGRIPYARGNQRWNINQEP